MHQRQLGSSGIAVGAIGLGCMGMTQGYDQDDVDDARSAEVLRLAPKLGVTLLDTAPVYGAYRNESLVGEAVAGRRDEVVLATKCGLYPGEAGFVRDGRPETILRSCDESLARLGVEVIDLLQLHRVDPEVPIEETWGAMARLREAGKVRALGLSEATIDEVRRAHAVSAVDAVQSELSLWTRHWVDDVLAWTAQSGAAFLAYAPLGRGFLTGTLGASRSFDPRDFRARLPRFQPEAMAANQALAAQVRSVADSLGATPAQVCLAWLLAQGPGVIPIPGTTRPERLRENAAAAELALDEGTLAALTALPAPTGDRY